MWPGLSPTSIPSGILIHPTVWPQYTNVTDRQDRQTDRQTDICPISHPIVKDEWFYKQSPKNVVMTTYVSQGEVIWLFMFSKLLSDHHDVVVRYWTVFLGCWEYPHRYRGVTVQTIEQWPLHFWWCCQVKHTNGIHSFCQINCIIYYVLLSQDN